MPSAADCFTSVKVEPCIQLQHMEECTAQSQV